MHAPVNQNIVLTDHAANKFKQRKIHTRAKREIFNQVFAKLIITKISKMKTTVLAMLKSNALAICAADCNSAAPREVVRPLRLNYIAERFDALTIFHFGRADFH